MVPNEKNSKYIMNITKTRLDVTKLIGQTMQIINIYITITVVFVSADVNDENMHD